MRVILPPDRAHGQPSVVELPTTEAARRIEAGTAQPIQREMRITHPRFTEDSHGPHHHRTTR